MISPELAARAGAFSARIVFVVAAPPKIDISIIASLRGAIEPLIHSPESIHSARVSRVSVIDNSVLERERAHSGTPQYSRLFWYSLP